MYAYLTVSRYPKRYTFFALWSMALFHLFLRRRKDLAAYKLMGSGRSASFDLWPHWQQWAIFHFSEEKLAPPLRDIAAPGFLEKLYGRQIARWWKQFRTEQWTICMEVIEGHGTWDGFQPSLKADDPLLPHEPVAVLTRATIRWRSLRSFWKRVRPVSDTLQKATGLQYSVGLGEMPVYRQATFSIWENLDSIKAFAYRMQEHKEVVRDTRTFQWYREEMFLRMRPLYTLGSIDGTNPFPLREPGSGC